MSDYLESLPTGSKVEQNVLPAITGLTASNWTQIKAALTANSTKFVDLSATLLPAGIISMYRGFYECTNLVVAPVIPDSVTDMECCFSDCSSLTTAPAIPDSVTDMNCCFYGCSSLTAAPAIPDSVTDMGNCFYGCSSLTAAPAIPDSVAEMGYCFSGCSSLTTGPSTIPSGVTNMSYCFKDCSSLTGEIVINAEITNSLKWNDAFTNVPSSVTVKVKTGMKSVIETSASSDSSPYTLNCNIVEMP